MSPSKRRNLLLRFGRKAQTLPALLSVGLGACRAPDKDEPGEPPPIESVSEGLAPMPRTALDPEFMLRGMLALKKRMGDETNLLELRAVPRKLSVQVKVGDSIQEFVYVETEDPKTLGRIDGPRSSPLLGEGKIEDNLFPAREIDVVGIGKAFDVAKRAVDPDDGLVERVIVRRFLPFGEGVRARIYVASPRLPGSIDTNPNGVPLKR